MLSWLLCRSRRPYSTKTRIKTAVFGSKVFDSADDSSQTQINAAKFLLEKEGIYDMYMSERLYIKKRAIADGTFMKAPDGTDTKLSE